MISIHSGCVLDIITFFNLIYIDYYKVQDEYSCKMTKYYDDYFAKIPDIQLPLQPDINIIHIDWDAFNKIYTLVTEESYFKSRSSYIDIIFVLKHIRIPEDRYIRPYIDRIDFMHLNEEDAFKILTQIFNKVFINLINRNNHILFKKAESRHRTAIAIKFCNTENLDDALNLISGTRIGVDIRYFYNELAKGYAKKPSDKMKMLLGIYDNVRIIGDRNHTRWYPRVSKIKHLIKTYSLSHIDHLILMQLK